MFVQPQTECAAHAATGCSVTEFEQIFQGRVFDFGNKKSRDQPVDVDVASGVPCGIAARRGEPHHLHSSF